MLNAKLLTFSILFNFILIFYYKQISDFIGIYDYPRGERKIHKKPIPLYGGIIIFFNLLIFFLYNFYSDTSFNFINLNIFFLFLTVIFLIGLADDYREQGYLYKFFSLSLAIFFLIFIDNNLLLSEIYFETFSFKINFSFFSYFISILCFLLFINASNMFDGTNLQYSLYSFIVILIFFFKSNQLIFIYILIALLFFMFLNFNGKIFLGESGVLILSFIISFFSIKFFKSNLISVEEIFLIMYFPGLDMFRLFFHRLVNKKNPFKGDKNHFHHILNNFFSEKISVLLIIFLSFLFYFIYQYYRSNIIILLSIISYFLFYVLLIFTLKMDR